MSWVNSKRGSIVLNCTHRSLLRISAHFLHHTASGEPDAGPAPILRGFDARLLRRKSTLAVFGLGLFSTLSAFHICELLLPAGANFCCFFSPHSRRFMHWARSFKGPRRSHSRRPTRRFRLGLLPWSSHEVKATDHLKCIGGKTDSKLQGSFNGELHMRANTLITSGWAASQLLSELFQDGRQSPLSPGEKNVIGKIRKAQCLDEKKMQRSSAAFEQGTFPQSGVSCAQPDPGTSLSFWPSFPYRTLRRWLGK